jgi:DMSO reductase anchor subunit
MACVAGWTIAQVTDHITVGWALACAGLALVLYLCTGMIYAAVSAMREWATPLTPLNFALLGSASGLLLCTALAALGQPALVPGLVLATLVALPIAGFWRVLAQWRALTLAPKTTLGSAIGVRHPRIVPISAGMTAPTFGTREFMHGHGPAALWAVRILAALLVVLLPLAVLVYERDALGPGTAMLLFLGQYAGLLAERWSFFAEARHPQNLYQPPRG